MIQVIFEGENITDNISINACVHDMFAEKQSDTLLIRFNDTNNLWDKWNPKVGNEITVNYGNIGTGKMYVYGALPTNGLYELKAASMPPSVYEVKNKAWQQISFFKMGAEIAANHGLSFASYGAEDYLYPYILQENTTDFYFLQKRCELEGCAFLVYDNKLILYSEPYMENQQPMETLSIGVDDDYRYWDDTARLYGSCTIERGNYQGSFDGGNGMARVYTPEEKITVGSAIEAERFAKNLLRSKNKNAKNGYFLGRILPEYAAASVLKLQNERAPSWDGNIFLTHIRNDYAKGLAKIFFRKPLEGY